jgi:hypothetical protein
MHSDRVCENDNEKQLSASQQQAATGIEKALTAQ